MHVFSPFVSAAGRSLGAASLALGWLLVIPAEAALPTVTVAPDPSFPEAHEAGPAPAVFRFTRTGDLSEPLTVHFNYSGGSATPNLDFLVWETQVTFERAAATAFTCVLPRCDRLP